MGRYNVDYRAGERTGGRMDGGMVGGIEIGKDIWTRGNHTLLIDGLMGHDPIINVILLYVFD